MGEYNLSVLQAEIGHIKEKVDEIDSELKSMKLGARIAVLEDRQRTIFGLIGLCGTTISGVLTWLFTH